MRLGGDGDAHARRALLAVADGVGGGPSGELASEIAIETLTRGYVRAQESHPRALLDELFTTANQRILEAGNRRQQDRGMACTLVAALVRDGDLWVANVGDSRAYLRQGGSLTQVTNDHSLAADNSLEPGLRELAAGRPGARHVLTRSLGNSSGGSPDFYWPFRLEIGDCVLLCSDGLYNVVAVEKLQAALETSAGEGDQTARRLVSMANERGAPDNVSVVILRAVSCPHHHAEGLTR